MAGPLIAYAAGKVLDAVGLPSGLTNPVGYVTGQIGNAIGNAIGVPGQLLTDPKGFVKDKAIEAMRNAPSVPGGGEEGGRGESSSVNQGFDLRRRNFGQDEDGYKRGGKVKSKVSSASKRADGIAQRGKTRGRYL